MDINFRLHESGELLSIRRGSGWKVGGRIRKGGPDIVKQSVRSFGNGGAAVKDTYCLPHAPKSVGGSEMDIGPG
jgi:hypothetical protein